MLKKWLSDPNTQSGMMAALAGIIGVIAGIMSKQTDIGTGAGTIVYIIAKWIVPSNTALQTDLQTATTDLVNQVNTKVVTKTALVAPVTKAS